MEFSEAEIKRAADLKLWIESRLEELEAESTRLKEVLDLVDSVLRTTSFKAARQFSPQPPMPEAEEGVIGERAPPNEAEFKETRPLKRTRDGYLLGNAYISASTVAIVPASDAKLNISAPPFKSFFVDRILEGMKAKDNEILAQAKINPDEVMHYQVVEENGLIKKILVSNYRDKTRLNEIINTAIWAFTRMLEKKA